MLASLTTGCLMRYSGTLRRMFSVFLSASNFPVWTPMTPARSCTSPRAGQGGQDMVAVDAAIRPEVEQDHLALELCQAIGPELIQPTPPSRLGSASWPKRPTEPASVPNGLELEGCEVWRRNRGRERRTSGREIRTDPMRQQAATGRKCIMPEDLMVARDLECDASSYPDVSIVTGRREMGRRAGAGDGFLGAESRFDFVHWQRARLC